MTDRKVAEVFSPGEFIKEELEARNWSQVDLAEIIGRNPNVVNELIMGKRSITPETAKALGDAFGTSAQYWMNLESIYQIWHLKDVDNTIARRAKLYELAPVKEMIRREWIEPSRNIEVLEKRLLEFFDLKSPDDKVQFPYAARRVEYSPAQIAWFFRAKQLAKVIPAKPFSAESFDAALRELKRLLYEAQDIRHIPNILAEAGIRFLIVEHLPHTKIDGAAFWLNKDKAKPVIVLSMRYDRIDYFWFTLAHELAHISKGDCREDVALDIELVGNEGQSEQTSQSERCADQFAADFLIDQSQLNNFISRVRPLYSTQKILGFAAYNKVHAGIVVGQLQFRKEIRWGSYRRMLEKVKYIMTESALTDGWGHTVPAL